jgi:hypothetical protein
MTALPAATVMMVAAVVVVVLERYTCLVTTALQICREVF